MSIKGMTTWTIVFGALWICPAKGQNIKNWTRTGTDGRWDDPNNWNPILPPDSADTARHLNTQTAILVGSGLDNEICLDFIGDGDDPTNRFMEIQSGNTLTVRQTLQTDGQSQNAFLVQFRDGQSGNLTALVVGDPMAGSGLLTGVVLQPSNGQVGDFISIDVNGSVTNTSVNLPGSNNDVDVSADVTSATIDLGGTGTTMDVAGNVTGGALTFNDSAVFTAVGAGKTVTNAVLTLNNQSQADISDTSGGTFTIGGSASLVAGSVTAGNWNITSTASPDAVNVTGICNPSTLTVDGATVMCNQLGVPPADPDAGSSQVTITNGGSLDVLGQGWHLGTADGFANSTLAFGGNTPTSYNVNILHLNGELDQTGFGRLDLTVSAAGQVSIESELVRDVGGSPVTTTFEPENVLLSMTGGPASNPSLLETFSPDYKNFNGPGCTDCNPNNVLFTDSPCTGQWYALTVGADGTNDTVKLVDSFNNNPISGPTRSMPDALYVKYLSVASSATLDRNGLKIYYTTNCSPAALCEQALTPTLYGDFNGDMVPNDLADVVRFNTHYPSALGNPNSVDPYDPLVDWNCDGKVDCQDRNQFAMNWPAASLLECTNNGQCVDQTVCTFDLCDVPDPDCCSNTAALYADVAGTGGSCGPDGTVSLPDILAVLDAFGGAFAAGCSRDNYDISCAPSNPAPCCGSNGVIDLNDIFAVEDAFQGIDPCCGGQARTGPPPASDGVIDIFARSRSDVVSPGSVVEIDVYATGFDDLRGYQLGIRMTGGESGQLDLEGVYIDLRHGDYVFADLKPSEAIDNADGRMVASLMEGGIASTEQAYLGTFVFRASPDARGRFVVDMAAGERTFALNSAGGMIQVNVPADISISVR